jgi:hypothetical protein
MTNFDIRTILMTYMCVNECKNFPRYWHFVLIYIWCEALKIWAVCRSHCIISGIYWHTYNSGKIFTLQEKIIRIVSGAQPRTLYRSLFTRFEIRLVACQYILSFMKFIVSNQENVQINSSIHNTHQTSTLTTSTRDCICSHKYAQLAQDIIMSKFYCITKWRPNNILKYFNLIILWKCNFYSFNFKNFM